MPDLTEVATALYGRPPTEFTAARTEAVRDARRAGDTELARAVGGLRRPSAAAAAVNLLVRDRPGDLGRLLDLGVRLREAQAALAGADLRALHAEQHRAMAEVVTAALDLLGRAGPPPGAAVRGQVEATLRAAMGDPDAATAVGTGLLTRDLFSSGFEPVEVADAVAVPGAPPLAGVPGRRTPLRAVEAGPEVVETDTEAGSANPAGRRRGRLITVDEPQHPPRSVPDHREHGRVVVEPSATGQSAPTRQHSRTGTTRRAERGRAAGNVAGDEKTGTSGSSTAKANRATRPAGEPPVAESVRAAEQARRREQADRAAVEEDVRLAQQDADARAAEREAAEHRLSAAESRVAELTEAAEHAREAIARLRADLTTAELGAREAGLEVRHARAARTSAARAAERAESRLRSARNRLDQR